MKTELLCLGLSLAFVGCLFAQDEKPVNNNPKLPSGWRVNDLERPQPKVVTPGANDSSAPADAVVLFDGTDLSAWNGSIKDLPHAKNPDGKPRWKVENGYMEITPTGGLTSKQKFGDMQLHIEFATPTPPTEEAQRRGNSGVFLMGRYEIQIMDGFENTAYADGMAGAVYGQTPPLVNVSKKPGQWQSFDIIFTAPKFEKKELVSPAQVTILQNGVLVQLNTELLGPTKHHKRLPYKAHGEKLPIVLQNHGQKVRFRNIWVREIDNSNQLSLDEAKAKSPDLKIEFGKVAAHSIFKSETQSIWGGSVVKGEDGLYHMFYSRWPKNLGWAWVTDSEVAHAVSKSPLGPFQFKDIALPRRGKEFWDGWCTHNPTVHKFGNKYYLYHMGNTGDGKIVGTPGKQTLNWNHRNNQRIGVAVADSPNGPWVRSDKPLIDKSADDDAIDALMTSNPSVCQRPDGGFLMVYKGVGKQFDMPNGGPVVHCVATSDSPTGPFKKYETPVFTYEGERFPAEDPYIWYQDGKYRAIVKRIKHIKKKRVFSLVQYDSVDGFDWKPAKHHELSQRTVTWEDGTVQQFDHLERPQVVVENGIPIALMCAADTIDENKVRHSFNIQIPLIVTKVE